IPGVAAADAPEPLAGAAQRPVLADGEDEVLAAARPEAADARQERADADLVEADGQDQQEGEQGAHPPQDDEDHDGRASRASLRAACATSFGSDRFSSASDGASEVRGISTRSRPVGISWRVKRNASR